MPLKQLTDGFDAVLLAPGAEKPATLRIPGEERAIQALPYLKQPEQFSLGKKVIVIGYDGCRADPLTLWRCVGRSIS